MRDAGGELADGFQFLGLPQVDFHQVALALGQAPRGDVHHEALVKKQRTIEVGHLAGGFADPFAGTVAATDFRFEFAHDFFLLHAPLPFRAARRVHIKLVLRPVELRHQFRGGSVTVDLDEGGIRADETAVGRLLENALR